MMQLHYYSGAKEVSRLSDRLIDLSLTGLSLLKQVRTDSFKSSPLSRIINQALPKLQVDKHNRLPKQSDLKCRMIQSAVYLGRQRCPVGLQVQPVQMVPAALEDPPVRLHPVCPVDLGLLYRLADLMVLVVQFLPVHLYHQLAR